MLWSEKSPHRTFDTVDEIVDECVTPALRNEGLAPEDYDPVGIALYVSEKLNGKWVAQTILLRDAKWWSLLPEDPVKRLVEHARIADEAVRRAENDGDTAEMPALEVKRGRAASDAYRAGASVEDIARRMHRESYRVYGWIKDVNDGQLPRRRR
ncbi:hypothetical protein [Corynebacterium glyciniphilum]|uniref:hypothetical protein n=1 Tax=Corynebacterium glyciniphilum TaxID=1404244 RepID=UPI003FD54580